MESDDDDTTQNSKTKTLKTLTTTTFTTLSSTTTTSRAIPTAKDFHFFSNFPEFQDPLRRLSAKSESLLDRIGSSSDQILSRDLQFLTQADADEAYDWLVNVNDEIYERFDSSIDEFERLKNGVESEEGGFQLVYGKKSKKKKMKENGKDSGSGVSVKAKVPFHIASIKRPQDQFNILVNNANHPFQHVWLERSEDGSGFVHPLEKLSVMDFVDESSEDSEPILPPPVELTPFKFVEEVKDLKELAAKLRAAKEFAVDLEHNQYRSFQGLTCLMQISTRTEDFIVDTFKLRIHIGPYLRDVLKDPTKKKVMHGADRDIIWLQRDFGIYVCNMFDTGQASRVLNLERNSLEYLLQHFCGITANKQYQNADWRLRPLPDEMLRYGREDTHYLLYIYDVMRGMLISMPKGTESSNTPLVEVYKRSSDLCMQLYEKELLTEGSYLRMYGLQDASFNAQQLAVAAGLFEWRDGIARVEDEGTGYILPNRTLIDIAKQMPVTASQLRRLLKLKHSYAERNLNSIVRIVRHSMQNGAAFEAAAQQLKEAAAQKEKEGHPKSVAQEINEENDEGMETGTFTSSENEPAITGHVSALQKASAQIRRESLDQESHVGLTNNSKVMTVTSILGVEIPKEGASVSTQYTGATVEVKKKPAGAFGSLLGSTASKRKSDTRKMEIELMKLEEKIRSSVGFQFPSFLGKNELHKSDDRIETPKPSDDPPALPADEQVTKNSAVAHPDESPAEPASSSSVEEIIVIGDDSSEDEVEKDNVETATSHTSNQRVESALEMDEDEPVSLSDLSTSFEKCLESTKQNRNTTTFDRSPKPSGLLNIKPFDYAAARKQVKFGEDQSEEYNAGGDRDKMNPADSAGNKKTSSCGHAKNGDDVTEFSQGRRRQAFPASGNRSATFL